MTATDQAIRWRKSSRSGSSGQCVELAYGYGVRDSKDPKGVVVRLGRDEFDRFIAAVKEGHFGR
jgi:hypothetical protein